MATNGPAAAEAAKVLKATVKVDVATAKASRATRAPLKRRVAKAHPEATLKAAKVKVQNQKVNPPSPRGCTRSPSPRFLYLSWFTRCPVLPPCCCAARTRYGSRVRNRCFCDFFFLDFHFPVSAFSARARDQCSTGQFGAVQGSLGHCSAVCSLV